MAIRIARRELKSKMKVMMLIAHGSRRQAANDEVRRLAERIEALDDSDYAAVRPAFLELAEPDIARGVSECVELGATEIVAVPYFLAGGRHVTADIPGELACARAGHPQVRIRMSQYLGQHESMPELLLRCSAMPGDAEP
jgi:sirohydrochlorin ferrochelatase